MRFVPEQTQFGLAVLRVCTGLSLFLHHGWEKRPAQWEQFTAHFPDPIGIGPHASFLIAFVSDFVCGILLTIGLGTRWAPRAQSNLRLTEGNLATSLLETGQTDEALEHIRKALELDPDLADGHNMLGIILARMGRLADAVAHLEKAVALTPNSTEYRFNLGRIPAARHSFAEAIPQFEKAVALTGGNEPQSLEMLAAMYAEVGHFSEAAQTARRALEIAARQNEVGLSEELRHRIAYYESQQDTSPAKQ
jgi:tetratricopeptide (TPR) repeat protein